METLRDHSSCWRSSIFSPTLLNILISFNQNHTKILPSARATAAERWNSTSADITRSWNGRLVALLSQKPPVSIISIKIIYRSLKQAMQSDLVFLHYSSPCDTHEKSDASEKKKKKKPRNVSPESLKGSIWKPCCLTVAHNSFWDKGGSSH